MIIAPDCEQCGKTLEDWSGNIMIDSAKYIHERRVTNLHVLCSACTRKMDSTTSGHRLHNLWGLSRFRENPINQLASVMADLIYSTATSLHWDKEAVQKIGFIIALTMPYEDAYTFLRYLNKDEWEYPGQYLNALNAKHGKEQDS